MDAARFDTLARSVFGTQGRRRFALSLAGLAAAPIFRNEEAAGKNKKQKKKPVCLNGQTIKASSDKRKKLIKQGATPGACVPSVCNEGSCVTSVCSQGSCQACTVTCAGSPVLCGANLSRALLAGGTVVVCPGRYAGGFTVTSDTILVGAGAGDNPATSTILDGQGVDRVLLVKEDIALSLAGVSVVNGAVAGENGGGLVGENNNDIGIADCAFVNNKGLLGGAIIAGRTLRISGSRFSGNSADRGGGLYFVGAGATCLISATDFSNNTATSEGGAIFRGGGNITLNTTTFNNNQPTNCAGGGFTC